MCPRLFHVAARSGERQAAVRKFRIRTLFLSEDVVGVVEPARCDIRVKQRLPQRGMVDVFYSLFADIDGAIRIAKPHLRLHHVPPAERILRVAGDESLR